LNNEPLVCICIPNYNNENIISETLDSIVNQTYKNIIIKIFDNASTDGSVDILKEYEKNYPNIQVFQNDTNIGGEGNFTKCIENMEGEYSAIYHSDDVYMPTIVEEEVNALENNDISAVFSNAYQINSNSEHIGKEFYPSEFKNKDFLTLDFNKLFNLTLKYGNFLTCPSCMAKTNIYTNIIKEWNSKSFKTSADLDVWLRFSQHKEIGVINKYLMNYRLSDSSYSYKNAKLRIEKHDMFLVLDYYISKLEQYNSRYYNLLILKDNMEIVFNKLVKKDYSISIYKLDVFNIDNLVNGLKNKRLFKFYLFSVVIKFILIFKLEKNENIINFLYKIRFKK
jgi:glycosyltransferase involved in cell wall biosynthesis